MSTKDLAIVYAAARVSFQHVLYVYQQINDPYFKSSLDKALKEIISIEEILQRYMEEPNGSENVQDNRDI